MSSENLFNLISALEPFDALERQHRNETLQWIASGAGLYRLEKPDEPPMHLVAYALVLDLEGDSLLLTEHIKAGIWLPPGGHVDPGEHPCATARRELKEELGVDLPLLKEEPLFLTVTQTAGNTPVHTDVSLWYAFVDKASRSYAFDRREFHSVRWFPFAELPFGHTDPHLERFCCKLEGIREKGGIAPLEVG